MPRTSPPTHPVRIFSDGVDTRVCRSCYRPTELEYRIACETTGTTYRPPPTREALHALHHFCAARLAELDDPDLVIEDAERAAGEPPIRLALAGIDRRLAIAPLTDGAT